MAVVDSYSESNRNNSFGINDTTTAFGQSFTSGGGLISSVQFHLSKSGSPTGNAVAKIYAHAGTFGTNSAPTGSALATSETFDVSTLTGSNELISFLFSGAEKIQLTAGTKYIAAIEYTNGDSSNYVNIGIDTSSPSHAGNYSVNFGFWFGNSSTDLCFYVHEDFGAIVNTPTLGIAFTIGTLVVATTQILTPAPPTIEFQPRTLSVTTRGVGVKPIGLLLALTKQNTQTVVATEELTIEFNPESPTVTHEQNLSLSPIGIEFSPQTATVVIPSATVSDALQVNFEPLSPTVVADQILSPTTLGIEFEPQTAQVAFGQIVTLDSVGIEFETQEPTVAFPALIFPDALQINFESQEPVVSIDLETEVDVIGIEFEIQGADVSISVLNSLSEVGIEFGIQSPSFFTENYLSPDVITIHFEIPTPTRTGGFYSDKYQDQNSSFNDKYTQRSTSYSDKLSPRSTSYNDKYEPLNL